MSHDSITEQAARAEAERRYPLDAFPATFQHVPAYREAFADGAAWALAHQAPATEDEAANVWFTPAARQPNGTVSEMGYATVDRANAEEQVDRLRTAEAILRGGDPSAIVLASRTQPPWREVSS